MLIRCSELGKIMSCYPKPLTDAQIKTYVAYKLRYEGLGKKLTDKQLIDYADLLCKKNAVPTMSRGAKTYADQLVFEKIYGRRKALDIKYLDKGNICEEDSTTLLSLHYNKFLDTRSKRKENEWITGECDIIDNETIIDIKTSWDYSTFPILQDEPTDTNYEWQLRGYMMLYDKPKAVLSYCLLDTPTRLINDELRRLDYKHNIFTIEGNVRSDKLKYVKQLIYNHIFSLEGLQRFLAESENFDKSMFQDFKEVSISKRIKLYEFERDFEK